MNNAWFARRHNAEGYLHVFTQVYESYISLYISILTWSKNFVIWYTCQLNNHNQVVPNHFDQTLLAKMAVNNDWIIIWAHFNKLICRYTHINGLVKCSVDHQTTQSHRQWSLDSLSNRQFIHFSTFCLIEWKYELWNFQFWI